MSLFLALLGAVLLTAAAGLVSIPLGLAAAGVACLTAGYTVAYFKAGDKQ